MYSFRSRVRFSEVDSNLKLTLPAILTYFQDCSTFHSSSLGAGVTEMKAEDRAWILSSWQIIIDRYPEVNEELTISTWAHGWKGFLGFRNFKLEDADGNMIAYANTNWIYLNLATGHPERIPQEVADLYAAEAPLPMDIADRKIKAPKDGTAMEPFAVRKSDIDAYHHVNNERYVLFAQEYLPENFAIRQMRAEYKTAAVFGDVMYPLVKAEDDKITVALNNSEGKPFAVVEFTA